MRRCKYDKCRKPLPAFSRHNKLFCNYNCNRRHKYRSDIVKSAVETRAPYPLGRFVTEDMVRGGTAVGGGKAGYIEIMGSMGDL